MAELKPCPFCGGEARPKLYHNKECTWIRHYVQCERCDVAIPKYLNREVAIEAWNTRVESEELAFTRQFIHEHGLDFALASAWNRRAEDGK